MDNNRSKEEFSQAYVRAIASSAGYSVSRPEVDDDSIDIQFRSNTSNLYVSSPRLEAQLKSTAHPQEFDGYFNFSLKIKNFNELRDKKVLVPRILIYLILPSDEPMEWVQQNKEQLSLLKCAYWYDLQGMKSTTNTHSVTITIPKEQVFSVEALVELIRTVGGPYG